MGDITFVIGGCKSGKSGHALMLAHQAPAGHRKFIATGIPFDGEMNDRIRRHRQERGKEWETIECPTSLAAAVRENSGAETVLIVDCITLWINNLLMENHDDKAILHASDELVDTLMHAEGRIFLVSNEVGGGIVPENPSARRFRDLAGVINSRIARCAGQVIWMVAGIPVAVKQA